VFKVLGELEVTGRDIRNLIRTAYGYAKSQETTLLGVRHVKMIMDENCKAENVDEVSHKLVKYANRTRTLKIKRSTEDFEEAWT
jgi:hypothetical protein